MALKSTYEIQVDDSEFLKFMAVFNEHRKALKDMVNDWKALGTIQTQNVVGAEQLVTVLEEQLKVLMEIRDGQAQVTNETERQETALDKMRRSSKEILHNIGSMTVNLLKWTSITGVISGLAGIAGSGLGIANLAQSAGAQRYNARGMGVSAGALNAFSVDYAPFGDGAGLLNGISSAQTSNADAWRFTANSLNQNGDTVQNALAMQDRVRSIYQASNGDLSNLQQSLAAQGLDRFFSTQDARRLGTASDEEYRSMQSNIRRDTSSLDVSDEDLRNWQELNRQIARAKTGIENTFIRGLEPLTPELTELSQGINQFIRDALADPHIKEGIQNAGHFLHELDVELKNGQLIEKFHRFADVISQLLDKLAPYTHVATTAVREAHYVSNIPNEVRSLAHPTYDPAHSPFMRNLHAAESWLGLRSKSDQILDAVAFAESGSGRNAGTSSAGARGVYQFMPSTAAQYGVKNLDDPVQERDGARRYLNDLLKKYQGSTASALAAYNWGPGNVDKVQAKYGSGWIDHLPAETAGYIKKIAGAMSGSAKVEQTAARRNTVKIQVDNASGTNISVLGRMASR